MIAATTNAAMVVMRRFADPPINARLRVKRDERHERERDTEGEHDLAHDQHLGRFGPVAMTVSAGTIVIPRRRHSGMRRRMNPCMTI